MLPIGAASPPQLLGEIKLTEPFNDGLVLSRHFLPDTHSLAHSPPHSFTSHSFFTLSVLLRALSFDVGLTATPTSAATAAQSGNTEATKDAGLALFGLFKQDATSSQHSTQDGDLVHPNPTQPLLCPKKDDG